VSCTAGANNSPYNSTGNLAPIGEDLIAQGTILNDDGSRVFSVNNVTQLEGTDAANTAQGSTPGTTPFTFRFEAQGSSTQASTFTFQVLNGNNADATTNAVGGASCATANNPPTTTGGVTTQGTDFINTVQAATGVTAGVGTTTGTVTFGPNSGAGAGTGAGFDFVDITVPVCADSRFENNENFRVVMTALNNSSVSTGAGTGIGTIVNDDALTYSFVVNNLRINEGNDPSTAQSATLTVTRTGFTNLPSTATYSLADGPAPAATGGVCPATASPTGNPDYANALSNTGASGFTAAFTTNNPAGNTQSATIQIPICGDLVSEPDENFTVTVTPGAGASNTTPLQAIVTIVNDDAGTPAAGFEGDINRVVPGTPGPGDGLVNGNDLTWYSLFASGQHCPDDATFNEFQRLDYNDNGFVDGGDYTSIFLVSLGLQPKVAAKGPTAKPAGLCTGVPTKPTEAGIDSADAAAAPRDMRVVSTSGPAGSTVLVPIQFNAQGNETNTAFSVHFDPTVLSISGVSGIDANTDITKGPGATTNEKIGVNATDAANGNLGFVIDFTGGVTPVVPIPQGTRQIAFLRFTIKAGTPAGTVTPVTFTSAPVAQNTVDVNGNSVTTTPYVNGTVTVVAARSLVIGNVNTSVGRTANVPVTFTAAGGEYSVSFTASWDPALLTGTATAVTFGSGVSGANCVRNVNTAQLSVGRIGVTISCDPTGASIASGTVATLALTPTAAATNGMTIPVVFANVPIGTVVGDNVGNPLGFTQVDGSVTILGTTAAKVSVSGRVTTPNGAGLRGATVTLSGPDGARTVVTSSLGYYSFDGVDAGASYVIGASSKQYRFSSKPLQITDNLTDVNFVGQD